MKRKARLDQNVLLAWSWRLSIEISTDSNP